MEQLKLAEGCADIIELRLDMINEPEKALDALMTARTKQVIVTCRKPGFKGSEEERLTLLKKAISLGSEYVDIESESVGSTGQALNELCGEKGAAMIISYHNFESTPPLDELEGIYEKIKSLGPGLVKIVTKANSINDNFTVFRLLRKKKGLVSFCMGDKGIISRVLAPKFDSAMTFASLCSGHESASGQLTAQEMCCLYGIRRISESTKVVGLISSAPERSLSKEMHNALFKSMALDFVYLPFCVEVGELGEFIKNMRDFGFSGASVTIPHKVEAMRHLDGADETSRKIGAVNTIVNRDGKLIGFNTDHEGSVNALKEKTPLYDKKTVVLGAGGAARGAVHAR